MSSFHPYEIMQSGVPESLHAWSSMLKLHFTSRQINTPIYFDKSCPLFFLPAFTHCSLQCSDFQFNLQKKNSWYPFGQIQFHGTRDYLLAWSKSNIKWPILRYVTAVVWGQAVAIVTPCPCQNHQAASCLGIVVFDQH